MKFFLSALLFAAMSFSSVANVVSSNDSTHQHILRVYVRDATDERALLDGSWDVIEMRGETYLLVLGDESTQNALRSLGYFVEVDVEQSALLKSSIQPFTYYGGYRTVAEHYAHLDAVAAAKPDLAKVIDYGDSWRKVNAISGGHDLKAICVTKLRPNDCELDPDTDKPRFFLIAAIHARELSTAEMAWRWIDFLVDNYGVDPDITALLDHNEMWVVPVVNPDGRTIVESGGSSPVLHRKNANNSHSACASGGQIGVDLNRNASFLWNPPVGASNSPCDIVYRGPSAASEPEEQGIESLVSQLFYDRRGVALTETAPLTTTGVFITLHSYGNMVLMPYGHIECSGATCPASKRAPNDTGLRALGFRMSYYNGYTTGQSSEVLYATSGSTDDWAYGTLGLPGYTFEIGGGSGTCGGFLPAYSCQNNFWDLNRGALLYAAKAARQPYALSLGPTTSAVTTTSTISTAATISTTVDDAALGSVGFLKPASQSISATVMYLDTPPWLGGAPIGMSASDGAFDEQTEIVTGEVNGCNLSSGKHTVYIRAMDADGNWGPTTATWVTVEGIVCDQKIYMPIAVK
jgi:hypothetical protein